MIIAHKVALFGHRSEFTTSFIARNVTMILVENFDSRHWARSGQLKNLVPGLSLTPSHCTIHLHHESQIENQYLEPLTYRLFYLQVSTSQGGFFNSRPTNANKLFKFVKK